VRAALWQEAVGIARAAGYEGAGTVEFALAPDGGFFFLEMNARLQVEHPVTELVTGVDLVEEQVRIAAGERLRFAQAELRSSGWAIECRICAEDAEGGFVPTTGELLLVREPAGPGIRFDAGLAPGQAVTADFDPLLAKLAAHGATREEATLRARRALAETALLGVTTNAAFLARVLASPAFARGDLHTGFLAEHAAALAAPDQGGEERRVLVAAAALAHPGFRERVLAVPEPQRFLGAWRN
jgi:acetyl/propionyl-CoA carboxylase alpha subunit